MTIGLYCNRDVVTTGTGTTVLEAAQQMRTYHVGTLLVVEEKNGIQRPCGIVTDRDLVLSVMAPSLDPKTILVSDVMHDPLYAVREDQSVIEVIRVMRVHGIRRIPIVDKQSGLVGIVSLNDLLVLLAGELHDLSAIITGRPGREEVPR